MGEKKGLTGKLKYDFNTAGVCEIRNADGTWARVTARTFRSYDGVRRITSIVGPSILGRPLDEEMATYDYSGPVYLYESNIVTKQTNCHAIRYNI